MFYSAQIKSDYLKFVRAHGAVLSIGDFFDLFWRRAREAFGAKVPKSVEAMFTDPADDEQRSIKALIDEFNAAEVARLEQDLFKQRKRLADAERTLQTNVTKAATESRRIATDKIEWTLGKLADIRRAASLMTRTRASSPAGTRR